MRPTPALIALLFASLSRVGSGARERQFYAETIGLADARGQSGSLASPLADEGSPGGATNGSTRPWMPCPAAEEWERSCHPAAGGPGEPGTAAVKFLSRIAALTYCDFWDCRPGDLEAGESDAFMALLAGKLQRRWSGEVCGALDSPQGAAACGDVRVSPSRPVYGPAGRTMFYVTQLQGQGDGKLILVLTFRGILTLQCDQWNIALADTCPRGVDGETLGFVDPGAAETGGCPRPSQDGGLRVHGGMASEYRAELRELVHRELVGRLRELRDQSVEVIVQGHSLGGGLAQVCAFDLAHSGVLRPFHGGVRVTAVAFLAPRVLGRLAAASTMARLEHLASLHTGGSLAADYLGLSWRGAVTYNPRDPFSVPTSRLVEIIETPQVREVITIVNILDDQARVLSSTCPVGADAIPIVLRAKKTAPRRVFSPTEEGEANSSCIRIPSRRRLLATWSQYYYMRQPLLVETGSDPLLAPTVGDLSYHAQSAGVRYRHYQLGAVGRAVTGVMGQKCPMARPRCGCPFRDGGGGELAVVMKRHQKLHGSRGYCALRDGALRCAGGKSGARALVLRGACTEGSAIARVTIAAAADGGGVNGTGAAMPCGVAAGSHQLRCAANQTSTELGLELRSTGLGHKMSIKLFTLPQGSPAERRYCGGRAVRCDRTRRTSGTFRAQVLPHSEA